jgi:hypothetical protein
MNGDAGCRVYRKTRIQPRRSARSESRKTGAFDPGQMAEVEQSEEVMSWTVNRS